MLEILATKAVLFEEYVRSELKDQSPDAVDVSDLKTATERTVVRAARTRSAPRAMPSGPGPHIRGRSAGWTGLAWPRRCARKCRRLYPSSANRRQLPRRRIRRSE